MSLKKPYIIFIEGQDRAGKTSVVPKVFEKRGKIDNVIDRGLLSNFVYSEMFSRDVVTTEYLTTFLLNDEILIFYLDVSETELARRTVESNDYNVPIDKIHEHHVKFDDAYDMFSQTCNKRIFKIQCDNKTVDEVADEIVQKTNDI